MSLNGDLLRMLARVLNVAADAEDTREHVLDGQEVLFA